MRAGSWEGRVLVAAVVLLAALAVAAGPVAAQEEGGLDLLFGDLIRNLQCLHSSISCFRHHAQIGKDRLLVQ